MAVNNYVQISFGREFRTSRDGMGLNSEVANFVLTRSPQPTSRRKLTVPDFVCIWMQSYLFNRATLMRFQVCVLNKNKLEPWMRLLCIMAKWKTYIRVCLTKVLNWSITVIWRSDMVLLLYCSNRRNESGYFKSGCIRSWKIFIQLCADCFKLFESVWETLSPHKQINIKVCQKKVSD